MVSAELNYLNDTQIWRVCAENFLRREFPASYSNAFVEEVGPVLNGAIIYGESS
jgi:hypothetical protein